MSVLSGRSKPRSPTHFPLAIVTVIAVGCLTGCGSGGPFDYVQVSGKVTYEDGTPIPTEGVFISFVPQTAAIDEVYHPRSGVAYLAPDGTFDVVTSYKYDDGIVPGKHKVLVNVRGMSFPKSGEKRNKANKDLPHFSKIYTSESTTPLEVHTDDSPFHIKVKKYEQ